MKKFSQFLAITLTVLTLSNAQPSQAAVAVVSGNIPLAIRGVGMLAASAGAGIFAEKVMRPDYGSILGDSYAFVEIGAAVMAVVGLVVLDGEGQQTISFGPVNAKVAKKIGITIQEREIYNSELDLANYVLDQVDSDLSKIKKPTDSDSKKAWGQYENFLSPETLSVMAKISVSLQK